MTNQKLRGELAVGYVAANGYVFTERDCEQYNRIQREIDSWIKAGRPVPEHLLNQSHQTFCLITGMQGM